MSSIENLPPETLLSSLTAKTATNWQSVGSVLKSLESHGRIAPDGEQWLFKVKASLDEVGHSVSVGHLHKVRRAYHFLSSGMKMLGISKEKGLSAKVSSIEIAERLYQLDSREGLDALEACLDQNRHITAADIKRRYDKFIDAHPEKKTAMHAAWDQRKKGDKPKASTSVGAADPKSHILLELQAYISSLQKEVSEKNTYINELEEELSEMKILLTEAAQDLLLAGMN
jgi:hypothetical protein